MFQISSQPPLPIRLRPTFLAMVLSLAVVGLQGQSFSVEGSMPEDSLPELKIILGSALKQSPQMILNEIAISQAGAARLQVDSVRWPSAGGYVSYASDQSAVSSNTSTQSQSTGLYYSASVSQSFFQWGALKNQSEISRIGVTLAEKNYAEGYRLLAVALRTQYLALVVKKAALGTMRFRLKLSESSLGVEEQKLKNGVISVGDIIGPRLALAEAGIAVERLEEDYRYSRRLFAALAGLSDLEDSKVGAELTKPVYSAEKADSLLNLLAKDNAESALQAEIYGLYARQADLNYRIAKVRLLPKFYVGASTSLINQNTAVAASIVSQVAITTQSVNVSAQWTLFDGFAARGAKMTALATKRYYERLAKTQAQTVLEQARNHRRMLAISAQSLDLAGTRLELAEAGRDRVAEEFKLGNTPQNAVDESIAIYGVARAAAITARAEFLTRWSDFVSLTGADAALNNLPARYVR